MNRYGRAFRAIVIILIVITAYLFFIFLWINFISPSPQRGKLNSAIFPAFRVIEEHCMAERFQLETVRCVEVLRYVRACANSERICAAVDYYGMLIELGFTLPPLYEASP